MLVRSIALLVVTFFSLPVYGQDTYWKDQQIMQLEELTPQLVESVVHMHEKINSI